MKVIEGLIVVHEPLKFPGTRSPLASESVELTFSFKRYCKISARPKQKVRPAPQDNHMTVVENLSKVRTSPASQQKLPDRPCKQHS